MMKAELRKQTITQLKQLAQEEKREIEKFHRQHLFESSYWKNSHTIGITISRGFEWDTKPIIEEGWKQGKLMVVPKCYPDENKLTFYRLHSFDELESVYYNLLEPKPLENNRVTRELIDLVLVPGVVFDKNGYRIGFGGGYYDRFLSSYKKHTISLLCKLQLQDNIPIENYDIPVNHLITEEGFIK